MRVRALRTMILCSVEGLACDAADDPGGTAFADSGEVRFTTAETPLWQAHGGWTVGPRPTLELGVLDGSPEYSFSRVTGAVRLSDGRIVVADQDASDLRFFAADGRLMNRVGAEGQGPGEFERLEFIGLMAGDSVITYDRALRRISVFDPGGRFVRHSKAQSRASSDTPREAV